MIKALITTIAIALTSTVAMADEFGHATITVWDGSDKPSLSMFHRYKSENACNGALIELYQYMKSNGLWQNDVITLDVTSHSTTLKVRSDQLGQTEYQMCERIPTVYAKVN